MAWVHAARDGYSLSLCDGTRIRDPTELLQRAPGYRRGELDEQSLAQAVCYREVGPWVPQRRRSGWPDWAEVFVIGEYAWTLTPPAPFAAFAAGVTDPRYRIVIRGAPHALDTQKAERTRRAVRDAGLRQRDWGPALPKFQTAGRLLLETMLHARERIPGGIALFFSQHGVPWYFQRYRAPMRGSGW